MHTEISQAIIAPKMQIKQEFKINFSEYSNNNFATITLTYRYYFQY